MSSQLIRSEHTMTKSVKNLKAVILTIADKSCKIMKMNILTMMMTTLTTRVMTMTSLMSSRNSRTKPMSTWISLPRGKRLPSCRSNSSIWGANFHTFSSLIKTGMSKTSPKWVAAILAILMILVRDFHLNRWLEEFQKHKFLRLKLMRSKEDSCRQFWMSSIKRCKKDKINSKEVQVVVQIKPISSEEFWVDMSSTIPNSKTRSKMTVWWDFNGQAWSSLQFRSKWDTKMMAHWVVNFAFPKESLCQSVLLRKRESFIMTKTSLVRPVAKKDSDKQ